MQDQQFMQNQNNNAPAIPDIAVNKRGWYPRWWLLAAFACSSIVIIIALLWTPVICQLQTGQPLPGICQFTSLYYPLQVATIWLFFLALWWPFMTFGISLVEIPSEDEETFIGRTMRQLTQFSALRPMLLLQGIIAFLVIYVMWWSDNSPPVTFALLGIIVFLAHCSEFQHIPQDNRRGYLISYGVIALILFIFQASIKRGFFTHFPPADEWPLLWVETLLVLLAIIISIFSIMRRGRQTTQLTQQQALNRGINSLASPVNILRRTWPLNRLFPQRPPRANQPPPQNQNQPPRGNPDPGAA